MNLSDSRLQRPPWTVLIQRSLARHTRGLSLGVAVIMLSITALHYLTSVHLLPYHSIYRSLYYVPVSVAAVIWGVRGGALTALATALLYLPHAFFMDMPVPNKVLDNSLEMVTLLVVAVLIGLLADAERHHRRQADTLRTYINDVLSSLPVGVATVEDGAFKPQNPAARLLVATAADATLLPAALGYHELVVGERPLAVRRSPLHDSDGAPIGQVVVLEDISEPRHLAEQVRRVERMAALGQLAGGLAHEVRNPLGIIRATAQLLRNKLRDRPDLNDHTRILTAESDRIDRLIGALLKYASPQPLERRPLDVAALLAELALACGPLAAAHHITLRVEAGVLPPIAADRDSLWQALLNVVLNAIQASSAGQAVALGATRQDGGVALTVRDWGSGIAPEHRPQVFDPFFTTRDDGTGMGLAVVARIIAEHGGTVALASPPDGGTCVTMVLPAAEEAL